MLSFLVLIRFLLHPQCGPSWDGKKGWSEILRAWYRCSPQMCSGWSQTGVVATHCVLLCPPLQPVIAKYLSIWWVKALTELLYSVFSTCAWEKPKLSMIRYVPGLLRFFWLHLSHPWGPTMTSLLAVFSLSRAGVSYYPIATLWRMLRSIVLLGWNFHVIKPFKLQSGLVNWCADIK